VLRLLRMVRKMLSRDEKYPTGAIYYGVPCMCGSRRTERIMDGSDRRVCHNCGCEGKVRIKQDGNVYHVYLEPINER